MCFLNLKRMRSSLLNISARVLRSKANMSTSTTITRAVTPAGKLVMFSDPGASVLEESAVPPSKTISLILNRPRSLHSLTLDMCAALYNRIRHVEHKTKVTCVVLRSTGPTGRAFCAGGDVRTLHAMTKESGDYEAIDTFFRTEYRLNSFLASLRRAAVVAIIDGVVMGGGVGLSAHGRWRVATENSMFAMPECMIGLHPDVGASKVLSGLQYPGLGAYLALTGARLIGRQLVATGIATHFVQSHNLPSLLDALTRGNLQNAAEIASQLEAYGDEKGSAQSALPSGLNVMKKCFTRESVKEVMQTLTEIATTADEDDAKFAKEALRMIRAGSPTSVKVAWAMLHRAKSLTVDECLKMEFRLTARLVRRDDLYAGVQSALITKDRNPKWKPASLDEISDDDVINMFKPLKDDIGIGELELDHLEESEDSTPFNPQPKM